VAWRWSSPECGISGTEARAPRRILGIDPGLRLTGFGLIEVRDAHRIGYVTSGVIRVPEGELAERLATIFRQVREIIEQYQPDAAAIEKVFVNVNPASTLLLGQARGAALCALAVSGLPVAEYSALQIKQAVVGYGRASKEQIQAMMVRLLDLPGAPACAVCHAHTRRLHEQVRSTAVTPATPRRARGRASGRSAWTARAVALGK